MFVIVILSFLFVLMNIKKGVDDVCKLRNGREMGHVCRCDCAFQFTSPGGRQ